jgi:hypothetical protein
MVPNRAGLASLWLAALLVKKCCRVLIRYLLPPIIFYAGLSVKKKQFFRNFATIASFGIFGTYVAFALIALVLYGIAQLPNVLDLSVRRPPPSTQPHCRHLLLGAAGSGSTCQLPTSCHLMTVSKPLALFC